jgi:outer membrane protein assembly factor BamB
MKSPALRRVKQRNVKKPDYRAVSGRRPIIRSALEVVMRRAGRAALVVLAVQATTAAFATEPFWSQWRGPDGQGVSREAGVPLVWGEEKNVAWKTAIPGRGHSSPIVWGERIFLTTAIEGEVVPGAKAVKHFESGQEFVHPDGVGADRKQKLEVLALESATGKIVWERTAWEGSPYDTRHRRGSYASPTPVTDGQRVYAYFGAEGLYAYDFEGNLAWKWWPGGLASFGVGVGTSPVFYRDVVILQCDEDEGGASFIVGLNKVTGKEVWRTPRKVQVSWATPVLVRANGRDELVTAGSEHTIAYDPATGKELWRIQGLESNAVPSPVVAEDVVIVSSGYPNKIAVAVRAGGSGDVTGSRVLWRYTKGTAYVPSPVAADGLVYLMTDKGLLTCLDAKTGAVKYEGGRPPVASSFMASPVVVGGRILLMSLDGDTHVIRAGPVHEVLGTNSLGEPIAASAAVAPGRLYIRGERHLFAIGSGS